MGILELAMDLCREAALHPRRAKGLELNISDVLSNTILLRQEAWEEGQRQLEAL